MGKNTKAGFRQGCVKDRKQVLNPQNGVYMKIDAKTGKFMKGKKGEPFKGVAKIKAKIPNSK